MITAVVLIRAEKGAVPELGETIAAVPGVSEVYSVTGEIDLIAMVRAREHEELADIVTRRIGQLPGSRAPRHMLRSRRTRVMTSRRCSRSEPIGPNCA